MTRLIYFWSHSLFFAGAQKLLNSLVNIIIPSLQFINGADNYKVNIIYMTDLLWENLSLVICVKPVCSVLQPAQRLGFVYTT